MGVLFADSFDFYSTTADMYNIGPWTLSTCSINATTRFGYGKGIGTGSTDTTASFGSNSSDTVFIAVAFLVTVGGSGGIVQLKDGATPQITFKFIGSTQSIEIRTGAVAGTLIGTYANAFTSGLWDHFQIKTVIHNTTGSVSIRRNGDPTDTFSITNVNTRGGTTNNYANGINIVRHDFSANSTWDDLMVHDNAGAAPNDWVGDIRAWTLMPNADTAQADFASLPIMVTTAVTHTTTTTATARAANQLYICGNFDAMFDGKITSVVMNINAAITGNMKVCVYDNTNLSNAGNVLATSNVVTNPAAGLVEFTFATPASVLRGVNYRIGWLSDVAFTQIGSSGSNAAWFTKASVPYVGGFPTNPTGMTGLQISWNCLVTVTPSRYSSIDEPTFNGDVSFNYSSTLNAMDLYEIEGLPTIPNSLACVFVRAVTRKSDSGARSAQMVLKSGATEVLGASKLQGTSYTAHFSLHGVDPNTGSPWTASAINALQVGMKVSL